MRTDKQAVEHDRDETYRIPFTDSDLARRWEKALHQSLQTLKSASA